MHVTKHVMNVQRVRKRLSSQERIKIDREERTKKRRREEEEEVR